jgi:REP element-mobilizing transposase RayT
VDNEIRLSPIGRIADSELRAVVTHYENVSVDEHIVMPNHVHAIFMIDGEHCFSPRVRATLAPPAKRSSISPEAGSLLAIVRSYKAGVTLKCSDLGFSGEIWQARFHDHLLRGDKVISAVREYIRNNPANWAMDKENFP